MTEHRIDDPLFDYKLYRFGATRQLFRGPEAKLSGSYIACLGGSGTFGRFSSQPFPDLVGEAVGMRAVNFGTEGAGPGFFLADSELLAAASGAKVCILQAMPASAISNRMFSVRPRRNRRLHKVSDMLSGLYPEVDFSSFAFVRAMLRNLSALDENRYRLVLNEMRNAWIARTQTLLTTIQSPTVLLWFSQRTPEDPGSEPLEETCYPNHVDREMIEAVKPRADGYVECVSDAGMPQDLRVDGVPVLFKPSGAPIEENHEFPSPEMHKAAAAALAPEIERLLKG